MLPPLADLLPAGSVVTAVVPRTGGRSGAVHEVRLLGAEPLIVKRYDERWRWKQAKEAHVYRLLAEHGVGPVPRVVRVDAERAVTVLTMLPGKPLSEAGLAPGAAEGAYRRVGRLLAAVHRIALPAYGYLTTRIVDPVPDNTSCMRRRFAEKLAEFAALGGPAGLHDAVRRRVASREGLFASCAGAVLCHGDLHEGNVLVDDGGVVTGVVDVENAIAADPLLDVAKTLQYDLDRSPTKRAALLEGYGPLPADGEARVELYRLYHALELWDWFASTGETGPLASIADDIGDLAAPG
ncbi:phosphotransferase family protein [Saccharothrix sp. Mg75]|uniref:phosphotransferase family protein n=1 Tax=Saccharothrix sp. Mg75 TaxID=3445357 RepID=UPI003EEEC4EA